MSEGPSAPWAAMSVRGRRQLVAAIVLVVVLAAASLAGLVHLSAQRGGSASRVLEGPGYRTAVPSAWERAEPSPMADLEVTSALRDPGSSDAMTIARSLEPLDPEVACSAVEEAASAQGVAEHAERSGTARLGDRPAVGSALIGPGYTAQLLCAADGDRAIVILAEHSPQPSGGEPSGAMEMLVQQWEWTA